MPPNARRRRPKIVAPLKPKPNPLKPKDDKELIGGLKNALERGESLEKVKKSFAAAGYEKTKVDILTKEIAESIPKVEKPKATTEPTAKKPAPTEIAPAQPAPKTTTTIKPNQKPQASKKFIIIIAIIGALILVSVGLIGLFWDKIF